MTKGAALAAALLLTLAGIALAYLRGGGLAWLGILLGIALVFRGKTTKRVLVVATMWALAWPATFYYVISTWESGEVVELKLQTPGGDHSARTWIMEQPEKWLIYYDAPPVATTALLNNASLTLTRNGEAQTVKHYAATLTDTLPEDEAQEMLGLMHNKYESQSVATNIFYGLLGRARDRAGILIEVPTPKPR